MTCHIHPSRAAVCLVSSSWAVGAGVSRARGFSSWGVVFLWEAEATHLEGELNHAT